MLRNYLQVWQCRFSAESLPFCARPRIDIEGSFAGVALLDYKASDSETRERVRLAVSDIVKSIEQSLGRCKRERWAPREIDIDILTYGEEGFGLEGLEIPHPGLLDRPFALWPLTALAPLHRIADARSDYEISALSASKR